MCRLCGREACAECFAQVHELTVDPPGADQADIAALQARREKHAHGNPFFLSCTRRNEHQAKDFSPMSRFCKTELSEAIESMENLLKDAEESGEIQTTGRADVRAGNSGSLANALGALSSDANGSTAGTTGLETNNVPVAGSSTTPVTTNGQHSPLHSVPSAYGSWMPAGVVDDIPFHPIRRFTDGEITDDVFRPIWAEGEPLLVMDVLRKFNLKWTPEYFMDKYESQSCLIIECQTDLNRRVTVGEFFGWFGKYEGRVECWKLKVQIFTLLRRKRLSYRARRTGHHPLTSRLHFQSSTRISVRQYLSPTM